MEEFHTGDKSISRCPTEYGYYKLIYLRNFLNDIPALNIAAHGDYFSNLD